jgi:hypothetical protein
MQTRPYPDPQPEPLTLWVGLECCHCGQEVCDVLDPDLTAKLLNHLCGDPAKWCR